MATDYLTMESHCCQSHMLCCLYELDHAARYLAKAQCDHVQHNHGRGPQSTGDMGDEEWPQRSVEYC